MKLTQREVSEAYVAIFNRASEGKGNDFWQEVSETKTPAQVIEEMIVSEAGQAYLGEDLSGTTAFDPQAFIELIYLNTLGKTVAEDAGGIAFWVNQLNNGVERGQVVVDLIEAVQSEASLYPDGIITNDITDRIPSAIAAQEQFENRVVVSTTLADHVYDFDYLMQMELLVNKK